MKIRLKTRFIIFICFFSFCNSAFAQFSLIRDAETEKFLYQACAPIFRAANLNSSEIKIYIVNDNSINAFVSGGQNIFFNTGLIRKYNTPDTIIGVAAHEVGHIVGGHIARGSEEMKSASNAMLLSYILGIGAAIAGSPEAAQGIILGGSNIAQKTYLKFSRTQEEAADRYALKYLGEINYPSSGLIKLLRYFELQMRGYKGQINEYAQSHPISKKRIDFLEYNEIKSASDKKINHELQPLMNRVLVKLEAFIDEPNEVLKKYQNKNDNNSIYASSIALYRLGKTAKSLKMLDKVIKNEPNDGFLYELKGQILYESGNVKDAILAYDKAINLLLDRDSSQAKIYFASAILALKNPDIDFINIAIKKINSAKKYEQNNPFLFKTLATAYHKKGDKARSMAALAQYNFLIGEFEKAQKYANDAKEKLLEIKDGSVKVDILRIEDLLASIAIEEKNKKKND
jgi:predicted Zn-dependent protease